MTMMNTQVPAILTNGVPISMPDSDRTLSLDTSARALPPMPFKSSFSQSPTSKTHFKRLPDGVLPVDPSDKAAVAGYVDGTDVLIVDIRPFNLYSHSRLKNAYNVCVPTTLLKRPSYDLQQVFCGTSLPVELKEKVIAHSSPMKILIYDGASSEDHVSFALYQTSLKFLKYDCFDVAYLDGGIQLVDNSFMDASLALPLRSPISPSTPHSAKMSNAEFSATQLPPSFTESNKPFLSGFTLPSATDANQKFLMSVKKNLPKIDTNVKYGYNFRLPEDFANKKDRLPEWLSFFADNYGTDDYSNKIVEKLSQKFNRLEQTEQVRLNMAISNAGNSKHLPHYHGCSPHEHGDNVTPLALCPCCDKIDYTIPKGIENGYKNRYKNIWPYEHSRVRLVSSPSSAAKKEVGDDYFNANYMEFPKLSLTKYIATQNPLEATYEDFWNTVWYNGVKGIVCLNNPLLLAPKTYYEGDQFYPKSQLEIKVGNFEQFDGFALREISMVKHNTTHKLYHFAYSEWPDFGTPKNFSSIFDMMKMRDEKFVSLIDQKPPTSKIPNPWELLVHCSAGCGRTGCFITIDMVRDCLQVSNVDDKYDAWGSDDLVYKSVQFQRQQRISMVQNLDQFIFCYESILNYVVGLMT